MRRVDNSRSDCPPNQMAVNKASPLSTLRLNTDNIRAQRVVSARLGKAKTCEETQFTKSK